MESYFKDEPAYAVMGDLHKQYTFAQTIKSMLEDMFDKKVKTVGVGSVSPFYIFDVEADNVELEIDGINITLTPHEQGAIAVYRYCIKRNIESVHQAIFHNAMNLFSPMFYNHFFVKQDWEFGPIYDNIKNAQV